MLAIFMHLANSILRLSFSLLHEDVAKIVKAESMCHVLVSRGDLMKLHAWLETLKPASYKVLGHVQSKILGKLVCTVVVNSVEEPSVVVIKNCADKTVNNLENSGTVFTTNPDDLHGFLKQEDIFDWTTPMMFAGVSGDVVDEIRKHVEKLRCGAVNVMDTCHIISGTLPPTDRAIPEGVYMDSLTAADADTIVAERKYSDEETLQFVKLLVANYPCVGAFRGEDKQLLAWGLVQHYGAIGMLHVRPNFRRLGLAACVIEHLARKVFLTGQPLYTFVDMHNAPSLKLFAKCGWVQQDVALTWIKYEPKPANKMVNEDPK